MTYIPRDQVTKIIPNKFEAVRVLSLECRRLNDEFRAREQHTDIKIASLSVKRLLEGEIEYYDARERREQERSEAMLAAAEGVLDAPPVVPVVAVSEDDNTPEGTESTGDEAAVAETEESPAEESVEPVAAAVTEGAPESSETTEAEEAKE